MEIKLSYKLSVASLLVLCVTIGIMRPTTALAATTPSLGAAASYGVLSSTFTNTAIGTTINGDIGFTTPPSVAPGGVHNNYGSSSPYSAAGTDQGIALSALDAELCTFTFAPGAIDLSTDNTHGLTGVYEPGVYCSAGAMTIGGPLTLSGNGTYIFRTDGALDSTANAVVSLTNGASACDAFWTPTQAATLGANTTFFGTIIDDAGITIGANTTWVGRALSFGETITTDTSTITVPTCATTHSSLRIFKQVVNDNGGTAVASDFTIHVLSGSVDVVGSPLAGNTLSGSSYSLTGGTYSISENANSSYSQSFNGDCSATGSITFLGGLSLTCTVINTYIPIIGYAGGGGRQAPIVPAVVVPTVATGIIAVVVSTPLQPSVVVFSGLALAPVPGLPNTGITPENNHTVWQIIMGLSILMVFSSSLIIGFKKRTIS